MSSVSGVNGAARTMKSDSPAARAGSPARRPDRASPRRTSGLARRSLRAAGAAVPPRRSAGGRATTRQPNAVARAPTARPIEPSPTIPTVTSRSSAPSSGCQVRSRCSSSSCGSRRLTARIIIRTYSAIGRLNTPRAFVTTRPRSQRGRRQRPLDAGRGRVDPGHLRRPRQQPVERVRAEPAAEHAPRRRRAARRRGPRPTP